MQRPDTSRNLCFSYAVHTGFKDRWAVLPDGGDLPVVDTAPGKTELAAKPGGRV
jgi:hypothetical protein